MRDIVRAYIEKYQLLIDNQPVLVGVSGGPDSIALLTVLVELGYSCIVVHCNFHLRGEESMRDEKFVYAYTKHLGLPYHKIDFETEAYAQEHKLSIEMAARELRYAWFEKMISETGAQAIAVAHHQDDSIETMLLNMVRGTGIRGLSGIKPKNGNVVRPMLSVSRNQILNWLQEKELPYVTDSTNLSDEITRNYIRLRVIPMLEELNPSARKCIARTAEHLSDAESFYTYIIDEANRKVFDSSRTKLSIPTLLSYPSPQTVLYELLKPYGFTRLVSQDIFSALDKESGKLFYSSDYCLLKDRTSLILSPIKKKEDTGSFTIEQGVVEIKTPFTLTFISVPIDDKFSVEKNVNVASLDADKLTYPLVLRHWRQGDSFVPFGMKHRKKLSDYFSDRKFNRLEKENCWILCSGENIVWIVGERLDNRFRINKSTKKGLIIHFCK